MLFSTASVNLRDETETWMQLGAFLDSQTIYIVDSNAIAVMLEGIKGQTPITILKTNQIQGTLEVMPTISNDQMDFNSHLFPEITNLPSLNPINKSQLKHENNFPLADPNINTPRKVDISFGSIVIEEFYWSCHSLAIAQMDCVRNSEKPFEIFCETLIPRIATFVSALTTDNLASRF